MYHERCLPIGSEMFLSSAKASKLTYLVFDFGRLLNPWSWLLTKSN